MLLCARVEEDLLQFIRGMFVIRDVFIVLHIQGITDNKQCKGKLPPVSHFPSPTWTHASRQNISSASSWYYIGIMLFKWNLFVDLLIINHLNACMIYKSHCEILSEIQDIITTMSH